MDEMKNWFGLKDGHSDFYIKTDQDAGLFFSRSQISVDLERKLKRSFRTNNPPKLVLFGDWGVGKTHTMRHVEHLIHQTESYPAKVVFRELPDILAKSKFDIAHAALLDALGFETVTRWLQDYQRDDLNYKNTIKEWTQSEEISEAFETLVLGRGDAARAAWNWLRAFNLSAGERSSADLSARLVNTKDMVHVLSVLGKLCRHSEKQLLIFMIDEVAKLADVTDADSHKNWMNALRLIAEQNNKDFGLILSASFQTIDDMPACLQDEQVQGRFGSEQYIELSNLDPEDTEEFILAILAEWIDETKKEGLMSQYSDEKKGEPMDPTSFPFTNAGLEHVINKACEDGNVTNPRKIQHTLDDILNRSIDDDRPHTFR